MTTKIIQTNNNNNSNYLIGNVLDLRNTKNIHQLKNILKNISHIDELIIDHNDIDDDIWSSLKDKSIHSLTLKCNSDNKKYVNITDDVITKISYFNKLRSIHLHNVFLSNLFSEAILNMKNLNAIRIYRSKIIGIEKIISMNIPTITIMN